LEKKGYLRSSSQRLGKSLRRVYHATPAGRKALASAKRKVSELFGELFEKD
jgi:DNA-binding PadR family transcriptional regulator